MRRLLVTALVFVCLSAAAIAGETKGTIGVSLTVLNNPFFKVMGDAIVDEAAKNGYDAVIVDGNIDPARQANQVKDFIAMKYSGIILAPCDAMSSGAPIREANEAGIPVFTVDTPCLDPDAVVVTNIMTDNFAGGKVAADAMIEAIGGKGKIGILEHPEVESTMARTRGFLARIEELGLKDDIVVASRLPANGVRERAYQFTQDMMQSNPDIVGIFACNDPAALGCLAALEAIGKLDRVAVVGFDGNPEAKEAIHQGKMYATAMQYPDILGRRGVREFICYMNGEINPEEILIPTTAYTKEDADEEFGE